MAAQTISMKYIKDRNERSGGTWFSPGSMRFFRTRLAQQGIGWPGGDVYFVTSEQFDRDTPRRYSVRKQSPDGTIDTVGDFQGYETRKAAQREATRLAFGLDE